MKYSTKDILHRIFHDKKAIMVGQVFIYSLSLIIITLILIFGFKIITEFIGDSSKVEYLQFKKTMQSHVNSYEGEYGSIGHPEVVAPSGVKGMCFTDYNSIYSNLRPCNDQSNTIYPYIEDSFGNTVSEREKKNLFLIGAKGKLIDNEYIGNVTLRGSHECNYLCMKTQKGVFSIMIIGRGDHVEITNSTAGQ